MDPTYDGAFIFGTACHVQMIPMPLRVQRDSYFGVNGTTALFGGAPGRTFQISGVLVADSLPDLVATLGTLLSYADGIQRTFTDTYGNAWPNVAFENDFQPSPEGPKPIDGGWCLPFRCSLTGYS